MIVTSFSIIRSAFKILIAKQLKLHITKFIWNRYESKQTVVRSNCIVDILAEINYPIKIKT